MAPAEKSDPREKAQALVRVMAAQITATSGQLGVERLARRLAIGALAPYRDPRHTNWPYVYDRPTLQIGQLELMTRASFTGRDGVTAWDLRKPVFPDEQTRLTQTLVRGTLLVAFDRDVHFYLLHSLGSSLGVIRAHRAQLASFEKAWDRFVVALKGSSP